MITEVDSITDKGKKRPNNQDAVLTAYNADHGIFAVADGMGGHSEGEKASSFTLQELLLWWEDVAKRIDVLTTEEIVADFLGTIRFINQKLYMEYRKCGTIGGCTLVVLIIINNEYIIASAGDSRIYLADAHRISQITVDDVWENLPQSLNIYTEEERKKDERFGKLTKAVGASEKLDMYFRREELAERNCFMLCSDGIYKYCGEMDLKKELRKCFNGKRTSFAMKHFIHSVIRNGAEDNYSAIICKWERER